MLSQSFSYTNNHKCMHFHAPVFPTALVWQTAMPAETRCWCMIAAQERSMTHHKSHPQCVQCLAASACVPHWRYCSTNQTWASVSQWFMRKRKREKWKYGNSYIFWPNLWWLDELNLNKTWRHNRHTPQTQIFAPSIGSSVVCLHCMCTCATPQGPVCLWMCEEVNWLNNSTW